jgi:thiosulfate reductase cytochrome b subunit
MITSGWDIYDDDVIIRGFRFSQFWRLGDWAAWSLNWHFAGMWFLPKFNAYYDVLDVKPVNGATWHLRVPGLVTEKRPWTLPDLQAMPRPRW